MNLKLFISFFKIGLFTFGGGYAMIPLIEKEIIEERKWISKDELLEIISISQMTPGTIAINAATFVGKKMGGVMGAIMGTCGVTFPSLIIITLISIFFSQNFDNPFVQKIFYGLRAGISAMILISVIKLFKNGIKDKWGIIIFILTGIALLFSLLSPIQLILLFGIGFIALHYLALKKIK